MEKTFTVQLVERQRPLASRSGKIAKAGIRVCDRPVWRNHVLLVTAVASKESQSRGQFLPTPFSGISGKNLFSRPDTGQLFQTGNRAAFGKRNPYGPVD